MKKVSIVVEGRVQGVGFRYTTKQKADELGIKGLVRNKEDGSVYIEAVGEEDEINRFIDALKNHPSPFSNVEQVRVQEDAAIENFKSFRITN